MNPWVCTTGSWHVWVLTTRLNKGPTNYRRILSSGFWLEVALVKKNIMSTPGPACHAKCGLQLNCQPAKSHTFFLLFESHFSSLLGIHTWPKAANSIVNHTSSLQYLKSEFFSHTCLISLIRFKIQVIHGCTIYCNILYNWWGFPLFPPNLQAPQGEPRTKVRCLPPAVERPWPCPWPLPSATAPPPNHRPGKQGATAGSRSPPGNCATPAPLWEKWWRMEDEARCVEGICCRLWMAWSSRWYWDGLPGEDHIQNKWQLEGQNAKAATTVSLSITRLAPWCSRKNLGLGTLVSTPNIP